MAPTEPGAAPGLLPQQVADATARLERYLAQRYTSVESAYQTRRLWLRFVAFQVDRPAASLWEAAQAWLGAIPASRQALARSILKSAFGATACDWRALVLKPYRRNELRLSAGVFRGEARAKVRAAARSPRELALIETLWTLRCAEVAALCWGELDLDRGMITVPKGKGNKPSWTLLPNSTRAALAAWRVDAGSPAAAAPVFSTRAGRPYKPPSIGWLVRQLLTRAGLYTKGGGSCHRFRRSFATQYLKSNPSDLVGLSRLMRHDLLATTQRYVWYEPEDLAPRMAALEL